jgi:allantoin racemase
MSPQPEITVLPFDQGRVNPFGPAIIEHRTAQAGFTELGTYFMAFPDGGHTALWSLHYEESIYVIAGEAFLIVAGDDGETKVRAKEGELIGLPKGANVRYGGTPGTRLLLSVAPVNSAAPPAASLTAASGPPRVLFLTPFHFERPEHDDEFDAVLESLLTGRGDQVVSVEHVTHFESGDTNYEKAQTQAILEAVERANAENYDSIVIACHYDPALREARESSQIPVVGPLQLTTSVTTQFGPKFAVITDIAEAVPVIQGLIDDYGHGAGCAGVTSIGWDGDAILDDTRGAAEAVDRIVAELAAAGTVQSVVIGCTIVSSAYEKHRHLFPDRGVVVLNSNLITVKGAAALAAN